MKTRFWRRLLEYLSYYRFSNEGDPVVAQSDLLGCLKVIADVGGSELGRIQYDCIGRIRQRTCGAWSYFQGKKVRVDKQHFDRPTAFT